MRTAFVTGGTGFVGGHLVRALLERGFEVSCLVREGSPRRNLEGLPVRVVVGDLRDTSDLAPVLRGVEMLFHCAADYRLYVPDPGSMYASNVEGTERILAAASEAGVERVVYTSTVGALGHGADGSPADERTPAKLADMVGHYKRSKFLAERVAERWVSRGLPVVLVHPSAPVGEADLKPTATGRMILDFLEGRMSAYVDTGLNLVDVRDVAEGHLLAAERGRPGERYILGHRNMSLKAILETLSSITGGPGPRFRVPHWIPMAVAAVDTCRARVFRGEPRVALDAVRLSRHHMYFDAGKAVRELGLPQTPVEEALRRAVSWFREEGYVRRDRERRGRRAS
jgi:dihydroflavonol-4-reductase